MTVPAYTLVVGVDREHLRRLRIVWQSWKEHKPILKLVPMIVFRDRDQVTDEEVRDQIDHPRLSVYAWPLGNAHYGDPPDSREVAAWTDRQRYEAMWSDPHRYKMLAGFVHIPALFVTTPYWLKVDTDVHATGDGMWIQPEWFEGSPAIISRRWGYTKPADQMMKLDQWAEEKSPEALRGTAPLNLRPEPGESSVGHKRIISWCAFFNTEFTRLCSATAESTCGPCLLPVPSQDGYVWYMAKRLGLGIVRVKMEQYGWQCKPVRSYSMDVLKDD